MFEARLIARARAALLLLLVMSAPAGVARAADDPFEPINRSVFAFNQAIRAEALTPLAEIYLAYATPDFRRRFGAALANLGEPVTALSGLAAGRFDVIGNAAVRFTINSTLGALGIADRAVAFGFERDALSPGDALCSWGLPSGPYLVLPLLGPTTLRDAAAAAVAGAAMGAAAGAVLYGAATSVDALHAYAESHRDAARLEAHSIDLYALHRSVHAQRRARACPADEAWLRRSLADQFADDAR